MTAVAKTVLISGAAQGLGLTVATLLAQRKYAVILVDIQSVEGPVRRLRDLGAEAHGFNDRPRVRRR
jgi:NAD(P)-dependent dehydrogenase (short-subunit alcohol dehydrogenase family)